MRDKRTAPLTMKLRRGAVCVAQGFGIRIRVERQHLVVEDGSGRNRRLRRYARATHGLSRLVVIGSEGYVSLEALRWLTRLGIGYVHLDRDGNILATSMGGTADARLRRQQALAATAPVGLEIARYLLAAKLEGQHQNLEHFPQSTGAQEALSYWKTQVERAATLDDLLEAEREAAAHYWACWTPLHVRFAARDAERNPEHWQRFGTRHSPLSNGPRVAVTPANAMLNYMYAILEAEARMACLTLGIDPSLGIWHVDYRARDSFALDLMEAARPAVDHHVLELIRDRTFTRADFGETSRGICRILPSLAEELAQTAERWRDAGGPHAERVARMLADAPGSRVDERLATPLTRHNRARAQDTKRRPRLESTRSAIEVRCRRCGGRVPHRDRTYCDACFALPQRQRRIAVESIGDTETTRRTSRRCKACGELVRHRKRVYCDTCFATFELELKSMRRLCRGCGRPVPHRKRVYCDACLGR